MTVEDKGERERIEMKNKKRKIMGIKEGRKKGRKEGKKEGRKQGRKKRK